MVRSSKRAVYSVGVLMLSAALFLPAAAASAAPMRMLDSSNGEQEDVAFERAEPAEPTSDVTDAAGADDERPEQAPNADPLDGNTTTPLSAAAFGPDTNPCAWRVMSNEDVVNVAFPDAGATYWVLPYLMGAETRITLEGIFPDARYMSLNTYNSQMSTVDTLRDENLAPDAGSVNPFRDQVADQEGLRNWTATIVPAASGDRAKNEIGGVEVTPTGEPQLGFVIVRIYSSNVIDGSGKTDPTGGVALPTVTINPGAGVPARTLEPCAAHFNPDDADGPLGEALIAAFHRFIEEAASGSFPGDAVEAVFANPVSTSGLFPNGDNKYIATPLSHAPNRVVVVRGKAPTFVNTRAGESVAGSPAELRYWSI